MKSLLRLHFLLIPVFSVLSGCELFNPADYAEGLNPVDSVTVFHNLINSYNTLDYEAYLLTLDSTTFTYIPRDTTQGSFYKPWGYQTEDTLTYTMFKEIGNKRRIPPLLLQVDTTYFFSTEDSAFLRANYLLFTSLEPFDTLGGGIELSILKRGNYWYVSRWEDVPGETIFVELENEDEDTVPTIDTIPPPQTSYDWSDLKVHYRTESGR